MRIDLYKRKALRALSCGALALLSSSGVLAQPAADARPLRLVVGSPPGGAMDATARAVGRQLQESLHRPVVVDNRPGAGAMLALSNVGAAAPDGSTVMLGTIAEFAINPNMLKNPPFDAGRLVPLTEAMFGSMALACGSQVPAKSIGELVKWARDKSPLLIGTLGPGSPHHLVMVMMGQSAGIKVESVPYRNFSNVLNDLVVGALPCTVTSIALANTWKQGGRVNVLAVTGPSRQAQFPTVPTFREEGLGDAEFVGWVGAFAPPGTSKDVADRLSAAIAEAVRTPSVKSVLEGIGYEVTGTTREEFEKTIARDRARYAKIIAATGMTLE